MRLWFEWTLPYWEEKPKFIGFALDWYRHAESHPWKGWTVQVALCNRLVIVNWVSDYEAYNERMNYRSTYRSRREKK